jgi:DNA (cytosine-5)-methyltransferase 1
MKYLSICSGIEAATVAWHPLGWEAVAFAEIEKFPSAVLKHHWPDIPNLGDMTRFREWPESVFLEADCIIAGTPCQAFSVAGRRRSLEDERGNLTLTFTQIIDHARTIRIAAGRPEAIILWENVPGCLSTKDNAFGCFLSALSGEDVCSVKKWPAAGRVLGEKRRVAWRIIDAQFAGVPQRRRRVFCVSCNAEAVADSRTASPEQILFIGQSLRGNLKKSKKEEPAEAVAAGAGGGATASHLSPPVTTGAPFSKTGNSRVEAEAMVVDTYEHHSQDSRIKRCDRPPIHANAAGGNLPLVLEKGKGNNWPQDIAPTLNAAFGNKMGLEDQHINGGAGHFVPTWWDGGNTTAALTTKSYGQRMPDKGNLGALIETAKATAQTVRRLTPVECERLQGFPDNHTRIPWRGKPAEQCPDGSRYKALGNSMAVPVIRWLGQRIQAGSELKNL